MKSFQPIIHGNKIILLLVNEEINIEAIASVLIFFNVYVIISFRFPTVERKRMMKMKKILILVLSICIVALGYLVYISYYHFDVTTYHMKSEKIQEKIKLVFLSDVHDLHCKIQDKIVEEISKLQPDGILCVGDMIDDSSKNSKSTLHFLKQLCSISEVYMSLGNKELEYIEKDPSFYKGIEAIGVHVLDEEYEDIKIKNETLRIGGMYDIAYSNMDGKIPQESMQNNPAYQFLKEMSDTSDMKILMSHRPETFFYGDAYQWDLDLVLSGHTHGGQIILPSIGGLYAPEEGWFPTFDYGLFYLYDLPMIITRGISSGGTLPRFNNPAEIVEIILENDGTSIKE